MSTHFNIPLSLLQAVQPQYDCEWRFGSGRGLCERASVLRPPCGKHVPGQRGQPQPSRSRRVRLSLAWEKTNYQSAHIVPWVTHILVQLLAVDIEFKRELFCELFTGNYYGLGSNNCKSYSCKNCFQFQRVTTSVHIWILADQCQKGPIGTMFSRLFLDQSTKQGQADLEFNCDKNRKLLQAFKQRRLQWRCCNDSSIHSVLR